MTPDVRDQLRSEPTPPETLEARVLDAVRRDGGFARPSPRPAAVWRQAVAALVIFTSGVLAGRVSGNDTAMTPTGPQWMLLLGGDVTPAADGGTRAAEYGAWMRTALSQGYTLHGAELSPGATPVLGQGGASAAEPLAQVGGYFIIRAASEAEAVALARTCPHVRYGGTVVVRRLVD